MLLSPPQYADRCSTGTAHPRLCHRNRRGEQFFPRAFYCKVQTRTLPSWLLEMMCLPSDVNDTLVTTLACPVSSANCLSVATSHTRTAPASSPEAYVLPAGPKTTALT